MKKFFLLFCALMVCGSAFCAENPVGVLDKFSIDTVGDVVAVVMICLTVLSGILGTDLGIRFLRWVYGRVTEALENRRVDKMWRDSDWS